MHGGDKGQPQKPFRLPVFLVTQEEPKHHEPPEDDEDLVARVAAVEEDIRRDHEQRCGAKSTHPTQVAAPGKEGEDHHADAEQGCGYAGGEVRVTKKKVRQRQGVELERSVCDRIVNVIFDGVRWDNMVDLVMRHGAGAEVIEARHEGQEDDQRDQQLLDGKVRPPGKNGFVEPAVVAGFDS